MKCYYCGANLDFTGKCPECDSDVRVWKKICSVSEHLYNEGLKKAQIRDLSGAVKDLNMSLRYNKRNSKARNLLGLIYFEMGEVVQALSEWVISKSFTPEGNPATDYLARVQRSSARLSSMNQTIRKYNHAVSYCSQGNYDMAVIQLKKVLSANPKMVKGHQLLGLLYIQAGRYDLALRSLRAAQKIDVNNTDTLRYIQECQSHQHQTEGKKKPDRENKDVLKYTSGNETIIRPAKFSDHVAVRTVVNLLIGAAVGIAVVSFLIIPEIRQRANTEANGQVVEANQTISAKEQSIESLQQEVDSLNQQVSDAQTQTAEAEKRASSYDDLLLAYVPYSNEDYTQTAQLMEEIDRELLDESAQKLYDDMQVNVQAQMVRNWMDEGLRLYEQKDYTGAIEKFLQVAEIDPTYDNAQVAYFLGFSYYYIEDYSKALEWYRVTIENTESTNMRRTSRSIAQELEEEGYTAPGNPVSSDDTSEGETEGDVTDTNQPDDTEE